MAGKTQLCTSRWSKECNRYTLCFGPGRHRRRWQHQYRWHENSIVARHPKSGKSCSGGWLQTPEHCALNCLHHFIRGVLAQLSYSPKLDCQARHNASHYFIGSNKFNRNFKSWIGSYRSEIKLRYRIIVYLYFWFDRWATSWTEMRKQYPGRERGAYVIVTDNINIKRKSS